MTGFLQFFLLQFIPGLHGPALVRNRNRTADHQAHKQCLFEFLVADAFFKTSDDVIIDAIVAP